MLYCEFAQNVFYSNFVDMSGLIYDHYQKVLELVLVFLLCYAVVCYGVYFCLQILII